MCWKVFQFQPIVNKSPGTITEAVLNYVYKIDHPNTDGITAKCYKSIQLYHYDTAFCFK